MRAASPLGPLSVRYSKGCLEVDGRKLNIDPSTIRASYLDRVREHLKAMELACGQMQADYVPINTKTGVAEALFTYFSQRKS